MVINIDNYKQLHILKVKLFHLSLWVIIRHMLIVLVEIKGADWPQTDEQTGGQTDWRTLPSTLSPSLRGPKNMLNHYSKVTNNIRIWDTFYSHSAYIQKNTCNMSRISPEPYFHSMNGPIWNRNFWCIFKAIPGFQIYHRPLWAKNTIPYFIWFPHLTENNFYVKKIVSA